MVRDFLNCFQNWMKLISFVFYVVFLCNTKGISFLYFNINHLLSLNLIIYKENSLPFLTNLRLSWRSTDFFHKPNMLGCHTRMLTIPNPMYSISVFQTFFQQRITGTYYFFNGLNWNLHTHQNCDITCYLLSSLHLRHLIKNIKTFNQKS